MIGYKAFDENLCCRDFQYEVGKTYTTDTKKEDLECCTVGKEKEELLSFNSGYRNSGNNNSGSYNSGNSNSGKFNSGNRNSGNRNSGNSNSGDWNSGSRNSGSYNSGNNNSGSYNSGYRNSGSRNSGSYNNGNSNSGDCNSGYFNSGNANSGDSNSGSWNSGNYNSGFFNSNEPTIRMFNKDTGLKRSEIRIPGFCYFDLTKWVDKDDATEKEKQEHENEIKACGGFLKVYSYKEAWRIAWDNASKEEHKEILELPNYDNAIFKEITGIDAENEIKKE